MLWHSESQRSLKEIIRSSLYFRSLKHSQLKHTNWFSQVEQHLPNLMSKYPYSNFLDVLLSSTLLLGNTLIPKWLLSTLKINGLSSTMQLLDNINIPPISI